MLKFTCMSSKTILHKLNRRETRLFPSINTLTQIIFIALIAITITFFTKNILAQNAFKDKQDAITKGNNQEAWLNEAMGSNMVSVTQMLTGKIPFQPDGSINLTGYIPSGAMGATTNMVASLYSQPVSGIEYIAQVKDSFLGKPAYAQGVGFAGLQPLLPLWKTLRNVVYILASLVFVIMGIMIMLRVKISPQAVVTIQSAIPKVVTALILVTFSYAIAGLIIDISNLFLSLCLGLFFNAGGKSFGEDLFGIKIITGNFNPLSWLGNAVMWAINATGIFGHPYSLTNLTNSDFGTLNDLAVRAIPAASGILLGEIVGQIFLGVLLGGIGSGIFGAAGQTLGSGLGSVVGNIGGGLLGGLLLPIVMAILIVIWLIKLYFGLLKCYITLIFKIIIGPLEIAVGAFPNTKIGFSSWIMSIIANISVFPITVLFLVFINYLTDLLTQGPITGNITNPLWIPSQISMFSLGGNANVVAAGIGLAGLGMLSKLPKLIPEVLFQIKPSLYGSAIGESYKPVGGFAKLGAQTAGDRGGQLIEKNYPGSMANSVVQVLRNSRILPRK